MRMRIRPQFRRTTELRPRWVLPDAEIEDSGGRRATLKHQKPSSHPPASLLLYEMPRSQIQKKHLVLMGNRFIIGTKKREAKQGSSPITERVRGAAGAWTQIPAKTSTNKCSKVLCTPISLFPPLFPAPRRVGSIKWVTPPSVSGPM